MGKLMYYTGIATERYSRILTLAGEALKEKYGINWRESKNDTIDAEAFEFFLASIVANSLQGNKILNHIGERVYPLSNLAGDLLNESNSPIELIKLELANADSFSPNRVLFTEALIRGILDVFA